MNEDIDLSRSIADLLEQHPQLAALLQRRGVHCDECAASGLDTLTRVASMHGIDLKALLRELEAAERS